MQENKKDDLSGYRMGKLTVLQLMSVLAILGFAVTVVLSYWFG